jgi:hypothetical protein
MSAMAMSSQANVALVHFAGIQDHHTNLLIPFLPGALKPAAAHHLEDDG